jgi:putative salt-induced outer membrane protein YdiY
MFHRNEGPILVFVSALLLVVCVGTGPLHAADTTSGQWRPDLKFSGSMTRIGGAHTTDYEGVSGISGTEDSLSWIARFNGRLRRDFRHFNQEHRLEMEYGRTDGEESQDIIDFNNILRYAIQDPTFMYGNARVRSSFDTFGHPTAFNGSAGLGTRFLDSDTYGLLELRTGPRTGREWNPSVEWDMFYELIVEYEKSFQSGSRFNSQLESFTLVEEPGDYTVRWENTLTASVNSWLDVEYNFTLYYEDPVGEVATKSISTVNLVYRVY